MVYAAIMRFVSFQVQRFRNVLDSGWVTVDRTMTALVGKNEAGKSTLLEALFLLKPGYASKFDRTLHYPRWLLVEEEDEDRPPISARFELEEEDVEAYRDSFGVEPSKRQTTVHRYYDDHAAISTVSSSASPSTDEEREEAKREREWLMARVPTMFLFGSYSLLPGEIRFKDLPETVDQSSLADVKDDHDRAARATSLALIRLSGTSPAQVQQGGERQLAQIEAASNRLTRELRKHWRQSEDLEVAIERLYETVQLPGRAPTGHPIESQQLTGVLLRVKDHRHGFSNSFEQRSSGFRWFFSFLAAFNEFQKRGAEAIVLLDEPGLNLHGQAQADLLNYFETRLAERSQVLYTTHSPFMVQTGLLERVRLVEDQGPDVGVHVSDSPLSTDRSGDAATLFPLQAALGYDLAQNLFIGPHNLVVEGGSDYTYLVAMSQVLRERGLEGLDPRWRIMPTGGTGQTANFVSLLGSKLDVTVLVDSDGQGHQRLRKLIEKEVIGGNRVIFVGDVLGRGKADVEDLFSDADYLRLVAASGYRRLKIADLSPGDRIVKRVEATLGGGFDHGSVAEALRQDPSLMKRPGSKTVANFEQLFKRMNGGLRG